MNRESISDLVRQQPFRPFTIHLSDGSSYPVPHPDAILLARGKAVIVDPAS